MHGGKREGSGRKKKEPTTTISFRVNKSLKEKLKLKYGNLNKLFVQFVDYLETKKEDE